MTHKNHFKINWPLVGQKLGMISVIKLSENDFYSKCAFRGVFFNEKIIRKIRMILDIENSFLKSVFDTFWQPVRWSKNLFTFIEKFSDILRMGENWK